MSNQDYSNLSKPYIPPKKSEYQKRIEIRYWKKKIEEAKLELKELGAEDEK